MHLPQKPALLAKASGQAGLIAVAVTILIALVLAASSLTGLSRLNATRSVVTKQTLQTYYTAQAGIQEALATRMLPRSNYHNFVAPVAPVQLYYTRSGRVFQNPVAQTGLVGVYRYVVVGGDAARQADGSYYGEASLNAAGIPRLLSTDMMPAASPFIVISNGFICKSDSGKSMAALDQITIGPTGQPACRAGFTADELTLVARVQMHQEAPLGANLRDRANRLQTFKNSTQIRLPANAFVPGYGWANTTTDLDFNRVWANTTAVNTPLTLRRAVFYNFTDNTVYADIPIAGATTDIDAMIGANQIPSKAVIRLYFDGPFDYRSISPGYDRNLADCQGGGAGNCHIRVMQNPNAAGNGGVAYSGNTMIPLFPGSTQVILLPPLTNTLASSTRQAVKVDATRMKSFSGAPGPSDYTLIFTTQ